jgi:plasmid stabilization system protein ParE
MEFRILDAAEAELRAAARYYDAELPGLGLDLTEEFAQVLKRILAHPQAGSPVGTGFRRQLLRRFPFSVCYLVDGTMVVVLAVAHHSRKPDYWKKRR